MHLRQSARVRLEAMAEPGPYLHAKGKSPFERATSHPAGLIYLSVSVRDSCTRAPAASHRTQITSTLACAVVLTKLESRTRTISLWRLTPVFVKMSLR